MLELLRSHTVDFLQLQEGVKAAESLSIAHNPLCKGSSDAGNLGERCRVGLVEGEGNPLGDLSATGVAVVGSGRTYVVFAEYEAVSSC